MEDKVLGKMSREEQELLAGRLLGTLDLLDLKEMKKFRLGIDYEDSACQELVFKQRGKSLEECREVVENEGLPVMSRYFNYRKGKELSAIMDKVIVKYAGKEPAKAEAAKTVLVLMDDKTFNPGYLPLLEALFIIELKEMENEIFSDPQYFEQRGLGYLESGDLERAKEFFLLVREVDDRHWSSYENLAKVYHKQGLNKEAACEIQEALSRIYKCWKEEQQYLDYEIVEEIEEQADDILGRDRKEFLKRLSKYAYGLLYFLGAAPLGTVIEEIKAEGACRKEFTREELLGNLQEDTRITIDGGLVSLRDVSDPHIIIDEVARRGIKQCSPCSLSGLKLAEEGRIAEMLFTQNRGYKDLNKELRNLTRKALCLVNVYEELRKDITGKSHFDALVNNFIQAGNVDVERFVEILNVVWNEFPRWELGGISPSEAAEQARKTGRAPQLHTFTTSFLSPVHDSLASQQEKTGRNDPCPCGSGKKFKKCCGR